MQTPPPITTFTAFDWILVLLVLISTVAAFQTGFIRALLSLVGLVAGIMLACWNYLRFATALHQWILSAGVAEVVAFLVILVVVILIFAVIARVLRGAVAAVGLGFFDRLLGGLFGIVRGLLFGVALMLAVTAFVPDATWVQNSTLAPYFLDGVDAVSFVVPEHLQEEISAGAQYLLRDTPERLRPHSSRQHM